MLSVLKNKLVGIATFVLVVHVAFSAVQGQAQLRKIKVGDEMPVFSLPDPNGIIFEYKHDHKRILAVTFLPANQEQSKRLIADIEGVIKELHSKAEPFDFVFVVDNPKTGAFVQSLQKKPQETFHILLDQEYRLWGQLGIIAKPTVLISGKDDKVLWIKAGYGYDFVPSLRSHLSQALGIVQQAEESTQVKTLANTSVNARVRRHLQMARMLEHKDRLESAVDEARKAEELDPNSVEVALELGQLLCRTNQSSAALDVIDKINTTVKAENARLLLISGWANRQKGELDAAEKFLLEATSLNPKSSRGFFELGKVYQARGQTEKAMDAYYKALALVFAEQAETDFSH